MRKIPKRLTLFSPIHIYVASLLFTPLVGALFTWYNLRVRYGRRRPKTYIMLWGLGATIAAAFLFGLAVAVKSPIGMLGVVAGYGFFAAQVAQGPLRRPYDKFAARREVGFPRMAAAMVLAVPALLFILVLYWLMTLPVLHTDAKAKLGALDAIQMH